jgi:hypothetical protein
MNNTTKNIRLLLMYGLSNTDMYMNDMNIDSYMQNAKKNIEYQRRMTEKLSYLSSDVIQTIFQDYENLAECTINDNTNTMHMVFPTRFNIEGEIFQVPTSILFNFSHLAYSDTFHQKLIQYQGYITKILEPFKNTDNVSGFDAINKANVDCFKCFFDIIYLYAYLSFEEIINNNSYIQYSNRGEKINLTNDEQAKIEYINKVFDDSLTFHINLETEYIILLSQRLSNLPDADEISQLFRDTINWNTFMHEKEYNNNDVQKNLQLFYNIYIKNMRILLSNCQKQYQLAMKNTLESLKAEQYSFNKITIEKLNDIMTERTNFNFTLRFYINEQNFHDILQQYPAESVVMLYFIDIVNKILRVDMHMYNHETRAISPNDYADAMENMNNLKNAYLTDIHKQNSITKFLQSFTNNNSFMFKPDNITPKCVFYGGATQFMLQFFSLFALQVDQKYTNNTGSLDKSKITLIFRSNEYTSYSIAVNYWEINPIIGESYGLQKVENSIAKIVQKQKNIEQENKDNQNILNKFADSFSSFKNKTINLFSTKTEQNQSSKPKVSSYTVQSKELNKIESISNTITQKIFKKDLFSTTNQLKNKIQFDQNPYANVLISAFFSSIEKNTIQSLNSDAIDIITSMGSLHKVTFDSPNSKDILGIIASLNSPLQILKISNLSIENMQDLLEKFTEYQNTMYEYNTILREVEISFNIRTLERLDLIAQTLRKVFMPLCLNNMQRNEKDVSLAVIIVGLNTESISLLHKEIGSLSNHNKFIPQQQNAVRTNTLHVDISNIDTKTINAQRTQQFVLENNNNISIRFFI